MTYLYSFQVTISLLIRISQTEKGAIHLISYGIFEVLAECGFISHRPESVAGVNFQLFVTLLECYHEILGAALTLTLSVLKNCGKLQAQARMKVSISPFLSLTKLKFHML